MKPATYAHSSNTKSTHSKHGGVVARDRRRRRRRRVHLIRIPPNRNHTNRAHDRARPVALGAPCDCTSSYYPHCSPCVAPLLLLPGTQSAATQTRRSRLLEGDNARARDLFSCVRAECDRANILRCALRA